MFTHCNRRTRTAILAGAAAVALLHPLASVAPSQAAPTVPAGWKGPIAESDSGAVKGAVKHTTSGPLSQAAIKHMFNTSTPAPKPNGKPLPPSLAMRPDRPNRSRPPSPWCPTPA